MLSVASKVEIMKLAIIGCLQRTKPNPAFLSETLFASVDFKGLDWSFLLVLIEEFVSFGVSLSLGFVFDDSVDSFYFWNHFGPNDVAD